MVFWRMTRVWYLSHASRDHSRFLGNQANRTRQKSSRYNVCSICNEDVTRLKNQARSWNFRKTRLVRSVRKTRLVKTRLFWNNETRSEKRDSFWITRLVWKTRLVRETRLIQKSRLVRETIFVRERRLVIY